MNSRERVLTTLRHQQADRVPIAEMWIDPQVVRAVVPEARDSNDLAWIPTRGFRPNSFRHRWPRNSGVSQGS